MYMCIYIYIYIDNHNIMNSNSITVFEATVDAYRMEVSSLPRYIGYRPPMEQEPPTPTQNI